MNVIAYRAGRCVYLCDFRNDYDKIDTILQSSARKAELDAAWDRIGGDDEYDTSLSDEARIMLWNDRITLVLEILEENGCKIVWDL